MKVQLDPGAYMPERAYPTDAGADLRTPYRFILRAGEYKSIDTGVHIEVPEEGRAEWCPMEDMDRQEDDLK